MNLSRTIFLMLLIGGLMAAFASGCGNSSTVAPPEEPEEPVIPVDLGNPFENATVGTDSTLEVMTWNLEHFAKNADTTTNLVIQAVRGLDVDLIGLQEISSAFRFQVVVDSLDGWSGFKANSAYGDIDLAYLYRDNGALQIESIQEIMTNLSLALPRSPLLLLGTYDGLPIAVINNHLKCCGDGYINESNDHDEETRRQDACLLLENYVVENLSDRRVFIVGDFNDALTDNMANNVFANFLGDPNMWRASDMSIAEGSSSGWSFPGWPSHLDHIIINQPLFEAADGPDAEVHVIPLPSYLPNGWSQYDEDISDHLPVVLKLKL